MEPKTLGESSSGATETPHRLTSSKTARPPKYLNCLSCHVALDGWEALFNPNGDVTCGATPCKDAVRVAEKEHYAATQFTRIGLPSGPEGCYGKAKLKDFSVSVRAIASRPANIFVSGDNGVGKTHLCAAMVRDWMGLSGDMIWRDVPALLLELRTTFAREGGESEADVLERLSDCAILFLDDLRAGVGEKMLERVGLVLNERLDANLPTVVTSVLSLNDIDQMDRHLASRLGSFKHIRLAGKDRRLKRGKDNP